MAGTLPPLFEITDDDHGGYVAVTLYTLLVLMIGLVGTRVFTRWYIASSIKADDYALIAAATFATIQSVLVQLALDNGLGRKRDTISGGDFIQFQKFQYGAQLLLIAAITCAKISTSLLVQGLLQEGYSILVGRGLLAIIIGWSTSSILALAFQCSLPHPWDLSGRCLDLSALHVAISSVNIITDFLLALFPCVVVCRVYLSAQRRNSIVVLFAIRIFVCVVAGVEIKYFGRVSTSVDRTWTSTNLSIWQQVLMNMSIMFTAIPSLGRLLVELQPAVNAFAITERHGARSRDKYILSTLAGRFPQDLSMSDRLGLHSRVVSSRGMIRKESKGQIPDEIEAGESIRGLRQGAMQQAVDLRIY